MEEREWSRFKYMWAAVAVIDAEVLQPSGGVSDTSAKRGVYGHSVLHISTAAAYGGQPVPEHLPRSFCNVRWRGRSELLLTRGDFLFVGRTGAQQGAFQLPRRQRHRTGRGFLLLLRTFRWLRRQWCYSGDEFEAPDLHPPPPRSSWTGLAGIRRRVAFAHNSVASLRHFKIANTWSWKMGQSFILFFENKMKKINWKRMLAPSWEEIIKGTRTFEEEIFQCDWDVKFNLL